MSDDMTIKGSKPSELADLLPCPFCGGEALSRRGPHMMRNGFWVSCVDMGCVVAPRAKAFTEAEAKTAWNTRSSSPQPVRDEVLEEAADELQAAESCYRYAHDHYGAGDSKTGRAWDLMRRAGDRVRTALKSQGPSVRQDSEGGWQP